MIRRWLPIVACALICGGLSACGGGSASSPALGTGSTPFGFKQLLALPGLPAGGKFSYDIGVVDTTTHRYYLADRTNASLDIVDTTNLTPAGIRLVPGFTGAKASNDISGPDGVAAIPGGSVYVGDVNTVKVVNPAAGTIVATVATGTAGFRTDEGCYDPDDGLMMFANPADTPPYASWISTSSNTVKAKLLFAGSAGLEQCVYDPGTKNFYINNDGTPANPTGELDVISAASVVAGSPVVKAAYPEANCGPTGMALGPAEHLVIGCDAPAGSPQITLIMNALDGSIVKTVTQVGGTDEVAYDPKFNRYYTASRNMTASGISATGAAGATFTPVLGVIDASTNAFLVSFPTVTNSHSVAVDSTTGTVFVPVAPTASSPGGIFIFGP